MDRAQQSDDVTEAVTLGFGDFSGVGHTISGQITLKALCL
jgi:hypothetical protein